jgi:hypothetical protein
MSTPAPVRPAREAPPPRPTPTLAEAPSRRPRRRPSPAVWLTAIFALAAAYHAVQGTMHVTPAVFTDELLHGGLARSFAAGTPFEIRDATAFFPAFLPALAAAPAWLAGDMETAYAAAKVLNALVMSAACFPAYWLARQVVRPAYALLAAAATVAAPGMLYSAYLLSEPLAYPVFLLAVAVYVRALTRPSPRWWALAGAVSLLAVGTRMQFVALPVVLGLVLALRRRSALPVLGLLALGAAAVLGGTAVLGMYAGIFDLDVGALDVARWAGSTAVLVPFAAGLAVVPGAVLGLGLLAARPRTDAERAFAWLTVGLTAAFLALIGVVAAGDSERPLGRYSIYLVPLVVMAFLAYLERGAPHRRAYIGIAVVVAALGWVVPFPTLADNRFSFDSPVLSAYGELAHLFGHANAATVFGAVAVILMGAVVWRPRIAAPLTIGVMLATGIAAYAGDHAMTERSRAAFAPAQPDWLDEGGYGRANFLGLAGGPAFFAWTFEAWNRDAGRPLWLGVDAPKVDPWPSARAVVADDGTLTVDGQPAAAGLVAVNDFGTRIGLEGEVVARPRHGLTLVRIPAAPHVSSLAEGLYYDGWARGNLRYRSWPADAGPGVYLVVLSLPAGADAREVLVEVEGGAKRAVTLADGDSVEVALPADDAARTLHVTSNRAEILDGGTANPRIVSFRVDRLEYLPGARLTRTGGRSGVLGL